MSHDRKCFDLAEHFLPNASVVVKSELADDIQRLIEAFLNEYEARVAAAWSKS